MHKFSSYFIYNFNIYVSNTCEYNNPTKPVSSELNRVCVCVL